MTRRAAPDTTSTVAGHRTMPHTADLIIEAWAPTFGQCLAEAVAALTDSYADTSHATRTGRHRFRFPAPSPERALVALLEEVLYVLDACGAVVVATHLDPPGPDLSGWFDLADVDDSALVGSVPKGISMSGLRIAPADGVWGCTATIDV